MKNVVRKTDIHVVTRYATENYTFYIQCFALGMLLYFVFYVPLEAL